MSEEFNEYIKWFKANADRYIKHNDMSEQTQTEITHIKTELAELRKETQHGNGLDQKIEMQMDILVKTIDELKTVLKTEYVSTAEFKPVKMIVYATVGMILTSAMGVILGLIFIKP